jgi:hypothetical protein
VAAGGIRHAVGPSSATQVIVGRQGDRGDRVNLATATVDVLCARSAQQEEVLMARKRTKGRAKKNAASGKRGTGKASKVPRKPAAKTSPPQPVRTTVTSQGAMNLLRAWSSSRYSTR